MKRFWLFAFLLATASLAWAHQPFYNPGSRTPETAFVVAEPNVSKVITAQGNGGQDWYSLDAPNGFKLEVALFASAACPKDFLPRLWLVGPGLAGRADFALPTTGPTNLGALSVANTWTDYQGHGVVARKSSTLKHTLTQGRWFLVVQHGPQNGWYFLSLGGQERPGGSSEGRAALTRFNRCQ